MNKQLFNIRVKVLSSILSFIKKFKINPSSDFKISESIYLITGGICITLLTFLFVLLFKGDDIWLLTIVTGAASLLYLVFMVFYFFSRTWPRTIKFFTFLILLFYIIILYTSAEHYYYQSYYQKNSLLNVVRIINYGEYQILIEKNLTEVFIACNNQKGEGKQTLGKLFEKMYVHDSTKAYDYKFMEKDGVCAYITQLTDDEVIMVGPHSFTKGKNPDFRNYNGFTGMIQVKGILNSKGVEYEIQN